MTVIKVAVWFVAVGVGVVGAAATGVVLAVLAVAAACDEDEHEFTRPAVPSLHT